MLEDDLKQEIQHAYSQLIKGRGFKPRYGQRVMIAEIAKTLTADCEDDASGLRLCAIEAGTGTGKTMAYLLAAIPVARALGKHLVVSTATIGLQEQIVFKDVPAILEHSGLHFSTSLAKGRGRYLCLAKLDSLLCDAHGADTNLALYPDEIKPVLDTSVLSIYQSMADALGRADWDGDRDSWSGALDDSEWQPVTTDHRQCAARHCSFIRQCSFFRARDALHEADCIVTNHDLVLADLALGGGAILPDPGETIYIFDEGHRLPEKTLDHFSVHARLHSTEHWLEQVGHTVEAIRKKLPVEQIRKTAAKLPAILTELRQQLGQMVLLLEPLFDESVALRRSDRSSVVFRFKNGVVPVAIVSLAADLGKGFIRLHGQLEKIMTDLEGLLEEGTTGQETLAAEQGFPVIGAMIARVEANRDLWLAYGTEDKEGTAPQARWVTLVDQGSTVDFDVFCTPILAADTLQACLWNTCYGAVVTSATLTALGKFDSFRMRSGIPASTNFQRLPSPFNYSQAACVVVPALRSDPGNPLAHTEELIAIMPGLLESNAGTLVLFSSRRQMLDVYEAMDKEIQQQILVQDHYTKQELIRRHKEAVDKQQGSAIFGLAGLAEGIDLPGSYCTHVIIAKIPFAVPDDPVEASLAEWITAQGGNPFWELSVPDAALRLVQASGRLLRTETDQGRITILDRRIVSRNYGQAILDSLPPFRREIG